jgi:Leucine-rich repeat (LRR) protein
MQRKLSTFVFILISLWSHSQVVTIPDINFKSELIANGYDLNNDGEIQYSEAMTVTSFSSSNSLIYDLTGIEAFVNLEELSLQQMPISNLNISNLLQLTYLSCTDLQISSLDISNLTNLTYLDCGGCILLSSLDVTPLNNLTFLRTNSCPIETLNVTNLINLIHLKCEANNLNSLNVDLLTNLKTLQFDNNPISTINLTNLVNLETLSFFHCNLNNVNLSSLTNLETLGCSNNPLTSLNLSALVNLKKLYISNLQLTSFDLTNLTNLEQLYCLNSNVTSLDLSSQNNLTHLEYGGSNFSSCILNNLTNLQFLTIDNSNQTTLDLSNVNILEELTVRNSNISSIDISSIPDLWRLGLYDNLNLTILNMKNGNINNNFSISNSPNLTYICCDESNISWINSMLSIGENNNPNVQVNSYCSFTPGGTFYSLQGNSKLDINANGCDESDINFPHMKFNITNGSVSGNIISNTSGDYSIPVQAGTHTITPVFENPTYFNISPPSVAVTFPAQTSPFAQNFCVTPNGVHQDIEVVIVPLEAAIPGFDASYRLVYKNKGNTTVSGSISFAFMDNVMDFLEANPVQNSVEPNILSWNYVNLQPFETRYIYVSFNLNSPQETPALNGGDVLNFTAIIDPLSGDVMPTDNSSTLNQEVVNSFDPNDKTCLEGSVVSTELIGQYVHYVIRFENTGTFFAQNVVVKDEIDVSKFDLNTLVFLSASHQQWTRINGNKVEFIFENIQLPFPPSEERHGYIAFKIKLKNNLTVGDTFSNFASIYFDYNFPIITEPATTTIEALSNPDFEFSNFVKLYPNPTNSTLTIESQSTINLKSIEIFNSLGQLLQAIPNDNNQLNIDVSSLQTGTYFIKVYSDKGVGVSKFVKQ